LLVPGAVSTSAKAAGAMASVLRRGQPLLRPFPFVRILRAGSFPPPSAPKPQPDPSLFFEFQSLTMGIEPR